MEHMRKDIKNPQVGGTHYSDKGIEPIEYICANNMDFCEGNIVKYVTRHAEKGKDADIKKTIQYALFILKYIYGYDTAQINSFLDELKS